MSRNQIPSVVGFPNHLVTGAQIKYNFRSTAGKGCRGRLGNPKILAYLHAESKFGHLSAFKNHWRFRVFREISLFVKLVVIGDVPFSADSQGFSLINYGGGVYKLSSFYYRKSQSKDYVQFPCFRLYSFKLTGGGFYKGSLSKQISAGIACQAEFGKGQKLYFFFGGFFYAGDDAVSIVNRIGYSYFGSVGGDFYKSVLHLCFLSFLFRIWKKLK